jgi:hypothetical protein
VHVRDNATEEEVWEAVEKQLEHKVQIHLGRPLHNGRRDPVEVKLHRTVGAKEHIMVPKAISNQELDQKITRRLNVKEWDCALRCPRPLKGCAVVKWTTRDGPPALRVQGYNPEYHGHWQRLHNAV